MTKQYDQKNLRILAMDYLARREHSRAELVRKLGKKTDEDSLISSVLDKLEEDNLLSDQRFAESFVRSRANQSQGPVKIRYEMMKKGVSSQLIEQSLRQAVEEWEVNWYDIAQDLYDRKYSGPCEDLKEKAKRQRFLASRGFEADVVYSIVE